MFRVNGAAPSSWPPRWCSRAPRPPPPATPSCPRSTARQIQVSFHPAAGLKAGPARADDPADARLGRQPGHRTRTARASDGTGNVGTGPLRRAGLQRADLGLARVRRSPAARSRSTPRTSRAATCRRCSTGSPSSPRRGSTSPATRAWACTASPTRAGSSSSRRGSTSGSTRSPRRSPGTPCSPSLYKEETVKGGWSALLYARRCRPGGWTAAHHLGVRLGAATGKLSAEDRAWFESRGPGDALVGRIRVPTLLLQGTPDTLFTPTEAIRNYEILHRNGVPLKMMWFCGGHGTCLTGTGPAGHFERAVIAWLKRYVAGRRKVATGPASSGWPTTRSGARAPAARRPRAPPLVADRLRHARRQPRRHRVGHAARGGRRRQRGQRRDPARRPRQVRRRAAAAAHLLGHRHGDLRVRPDRRRDSAASCSATR